MILNTFRYFIFFEKLICKINNFIDVLIFTFSNSLNIRHQIIVISY